jgi:hypothetical protein
MWEQAVFSLIFSKWGGAVAALLFADHDPGGKLSQRCPRPAIFAFSHRLPYRG